MNTFLLISKTKGLSDSGSCAAGLNCTGTNTAASDTFKRYHGSFWASPSRATILAKVFQLEIGDHTDIRLRTAILRARNAASISESQRLRLEAAQTRRESSELRRASHEVVQACRSTMLRIRGSSQPPINEKQKFAHLIAAALKLSGLSVFVVEPPADTASRS